MFKGEIKIHHKIFRKIEKEGTHSKRSILPWCQKQTRECVQSCFSHVWLSATLWTIACQVSLVAQMVKVFANNVGDPALIPGRGRSLEKEMATHSSTLAWKIPRMEEPGGLQSMGSQRVRHDWATSLHFSRREYWGELSCPPPGDLSNLGI